MKPLLIDGSWIETGHTLPNVNPSDVDDIIDDYAQGGQAEAQAAIAAAQAAAPDWGHSGLLERHDILRKAGAELLARKEEIGALLSREEGKILREGIAEVDRAGRIFEFFAAEVLRPDGAHLPSVRPSVTVDITREPVGVVGLITPWNFPIAIPAWKLAPALAYGNTVVLKPAELTPGCAWVLADILQRAGLPKGVLNLVMGPGSVVGQAMLDSPAIKAVSFTGSVGTGGRVAEASVRLGRKFQLEMGGKNPLVILDDADLDQSVTTAIDGSFFSTGQRCTASSRLIVTEGIHNRFVEEMGTRMRNLVVGHALDVASDIGPVVDATQLTQDTDYLDIARSQGGNIRFGGERLRRETEGFFLSPALVTDTTNDMRINREEVFGPVASVIRVRDYDEALAVANDTDFGLTAGICTTSLRHATHFKRNAQAGMVMVNLPTAGVDFHVPFGGTKASSLGPREQGRHAQEFYSTVKTAYTRA